MFTFYLSQVEVSPSITSHDFGKPILDFIPVVDDDNGMSVWVSLDQTRAEDGSYPDEVDQSNTEHVQVVTIASDGKVGFGSYKLHLDFTLAFGSSFRYQNVLCLLLPKRFSIH